MRGVNLLLVESKSAGSQSLAPSLIKADLQVKIAYTGSEALSMISEDRPDLVVVDATNMRSNGVRTCRRLRKELGDSPIIHCRNQNQNDDRTAGADVYLVQPFTARKLLNRVRILIPADDLNEEIVRAGPITLFTAKRSVEIVGQGEKRLTPKLATLLKEFLLHPNEVIGRHHLMKEVWDTDYFGDTRTLDVHIRWLREIIEKNPAKPQLLRTIRGIGYIFSIPAEND